jgi:hypothetical protein
MPAIKDGDRYEEESALRDSPVSTDPVRNTSTVTVEWKRMFVK